MDLKFSFVSLRIAARCFFAHEVEISLGPFGTGKSRFLGFDRTFVSLSLTFARFFLLVPPEPL